MQPCHSRAGKTVAQGSGYLAFVPQKLPPKISFDNTTIRLLSDADIALGRLAGITEILPNPELFVAMYVRKEAVLSSQIEGIQCTLDDVLDYATANNALSTLEKAGLVTETTGRKRDRIFRFQGYLQLFDDRPGTAPAIYDSGKPAAYPHGTDESFEDKPTSL